jgi:D-tyrosyl-tRNA(Tyr) deacylase
MNALLQRVKEASVVIDGQVVGQIGRGIVLLAGIHRGDTPTDIDGMAEKCLYLRIFDDDEGRMNRSVLDVRGGILAISQFTLCADTRKGRRPNFIDAALPEAALPLFNRFIERLQESGLPVATGIFGARMLVDIQNDGPVTFILESKPHK